MSYNKYIIYDQEPVKTLIDVPLLFAFVFFTMFGLILPLLKGQNKVFIVIFIIIICCIGIYLISLWSKFVTSNKLSIEITKDCLEISSQRKSGKIKICLNEIIKTEILSNGRFDHYKIYYSQDRIFTISKFSLYWVFDDFEKFQKELEREIKKNKLRLKMS
jgi:archaellum biogenesis protein FlaJ (TadC family)